MRMQDLRTRNPAIDQRPEPFPSHPAPLTPPPKRAVPAPDHLSPKAVETIHIAGHRVVVEVALYDRPQPLPDLAHWLMPASPKHLRQLIELDRESLGDGLPLDDEPARLPSLPTDMGETQKTEHFRLALAPLLPVFGCVTPELNQARLVRVQLQPELLQAVFPFLEKPLRVSTIFESRDDVICITDDNHIARSMMLTPVPDPQIEDIVQVDVCQQRRGHCPLRSAYRRLRPVPFLGYSRPQPFLDQAQYPSVGDAMLDKLDQPFVRQIVEKATNVGIENPVHLLPHDPHPERIQRIVLATPGAEPVGEPQEVLFVNLVEDRHYGLLNDLILQGCDAQGAFPSIGFRNVGSLGRLRSIRSPMDSAVKVRQFLIQVRFVLAPRHTVYSRCSFPLQGVKAVPQQIDGDVVEQRSEPRPLVFTCYFTHTEQVAQLTDPALSPGRGRLPNVFLSRLPSLCALRRRLPSLVRTLRRCRVGGGALARWPPSAAQTVRAVFPHTAFTKTHASEMAVRGLIGSGSPDRTRRTAWFPATVASRRSANA